MSRSGDATATNGLANTGVILGDVNLLTGAPVRTRYRRQVQRIAPARLLGRDEELAALADFCTSPGAAGTYAWWRASAWTGKSALMSWFVLHPPENVRLVSFFVTARLESQNDRSAFVDNVMEQLLALLGESLPPFLTESTRDSHLLGLLEDAAERCQQRGEAFVLLVDGLDEDRGAQSGHSIANLLPAVPPAGMRIIVAGRPNPPVPGDVDEGHPLFDPTIVRALVPSPQARARRWEMEHDLQRLLDGAEAERDLLGLVAGAGGGLSAADLSELTGLSHWQVENQLATVSGRSFAQRGSHYAPEVNPDVYLLGHEELQATALDMLGPARVAAYRARLRTWFGQYRERGWPADTPEYLLRGYFNMLRATADLAAMVECATDPDRQERLLHVSGGDVTALTEITNAMDVLAAQDPPDLVALVRLAIHRDHLRTRNSKVPSVLPQVWAMLGQFNRAETMANSITLAADRDRALSLVAMVMAEAGKLDEAENLALSLAYIDAQADSLAAIAKAAARAGDRDRAIRLVELVEAVAAGIAYAGDRANTLASAVEAAATAGEVDRTVWLLGRMEALVPPEHAVEGMMRAIAMACTVVGSDRASKLFARLWALADDSDEPYWHIWALTCAAKAAAVTGDLPGVMAFADQMASFLPQVGPSEGDVHALTGLATAMAEAGDVGRAVEWLDQAVASALLEGEPEFRAEAIVSVAEAAGAIGDHCRAMALVDQAMEIVADLDSAQRRAELSTLAAKAAARAGDVQRAAEFAGQAAIVARSIVDVARHASATAAVAEAAAAVGDECADVLLVRAELSARSFDFPTDRLLALGRVAKTAAVLGQVGRVHEFVAQVENHEFADMPHPAEAQSLVFGRAVEALVAVGLPDKAVDLLARAEERVPDWHPGEQVRGLIPLARAAGGLPGHAARLAEKVEALLPVLSTDWQATALACVASVRAALGERDRAMELLDWAEDLECSVDDGDPRNNFRLSMAVAAGTVDVSRVERLVQAMTDPRDQAEALARTVEYQPPTRRGRVIAQALRLGDWYLPVRALVELVPEALPVILAELDAVQR